MPQQGLEIAIRDSSGANLLDTTRHRYHADSIRFVDWESGDLSYSASASGYNADARIYVPHYYPFDCDGAVQEGTGVWGALLIHLNAADIDTVVVERRQSETFTYLYNDRVVGTRSVHDRQRWVAIDVRK